MTNALKGALLSALVIPGLGQLIFKCYKRAIVMIAVVLACLILLCLKIIQISFAIIGEIQNGTATTSLSSITKIGWQAVKASGGPTFTVLLAVLLICWLYSIFDAYAIGKKLDQKG